MLAGGNSGYFFLQRQVWSPGYDQIYPGSFIIYALTDSWTLIPAINYPCVYTMEQGDLINTTDIETDSLSHGDLMVSDVSCL